MNARLALLAALLVTGSSQAQGLAGAHTFGTGASGSVSTPLVLSVRTPLMGGVAEFTVSDGPVNATGAVILTHTRLNLLQVPPFPFIGGNNVYVDTFALMRTIPIGTDGFGKGITAVPIPPDPSLVGQLFATQAILLDNGNPFGGVLSNAALLAIGDISPLIEPTFTTLTSPIKPGDALFDQMMASPLTAEFAAAVETEGLGTMGFDDAFELKLAGDIGLLGPIPPDARIAIVQVLNTTPNLKAALYIFTFGTHPVLGLIEGADVMEFVSGVTGQVESFRIYTDATNFNTHADIGFAPSGTATPPTTTPAPPPYLACFGAGLAAKVNAGIISGLSAGCLAVCATCLLPRPIPTPTPPCIACATCALGSIAATIGCWWACP